MSISMMAPSTAPRERPFTGVGLGRSLLANIHMDPACSPSPSDPTGVIVGIVVGVILALALALVILHRRRRDMRRKEAQKRPAWWNPHKPGFYFLPRAAVLGASSKQLGRMQELRDSLQLVKLAIDLNEAFQGKGLIENILFVSHRWEDSMTPDETGAQLAALQAHLRAHPEIHYIWFDYACMPQRSGSAHRSGTDDRTKAEKAEFNLMLKAITDMYLTAKVSILLDTMYRTRFWTTMEGWCAMQKVTSQGVRPAKEGEARYTVSCIHNATKKDREALLEMSTKTQTEISNFLASPDVAVTNKKDKTTMLPIVGKTDDHVREMMSGMHSC
jgi:MYXO-CTERM domain-containing protein